MPSEQNIFPGSFEQIEAICELVDRAARQAGFDDSTSYACQLAVGEACENIICHGYQGKEGGEIEVNVHAEPGELTIELQDSSPPFDPTSATDADCQTGIEDQIGGLGIPIMHRVMDDIEYSRQGRKNRLTLRKRCTSDC